MDHYRQRVDNHNTGQPTTVKDEWCPLHHLEDDCYERALTAKFGNLVERFYKFCGNQDQWNVDYKSKSIVKKDWTVGIHANVEFWWREMRYV